MVQALTVDTLKVELARQQQKALNNFFQGDEKKTLKFLSSVAYCASTTPKLLECTQESIITSFMKCAEYNLFPSTVSGEVYILPYLNKWILEAQFQLGYKGIVALLGRVWIKIHTDIVKENDICEITSGMEQNIIHKYPLSARGKAIWVYAIATDSEGNKTMKYMSAEEVLAFRKFSKSANAKEEWARAKSPWNEANDVELNMWRKTVIKQISKNFSLSEEVYSAIVEDQKESSIEDYQKNTLLEQSKRPSEMSVESLLSNQRIWTEQKIESSVISNSVTSNSEQPNGLTQENEDWQVQDLNQWWAVENPPEKN